jgi:hypothetical protein
LTGITFDSCSQITASTNTLNNVEFNSSTASATEGAISITGASQAALQTAIGKFVGCSWSSNTIPGGALRIIYTGTAGAVALNMTSGTFTGNTYNIRWEAPAASNLTINSSGTCNLSVGTPYTATNSNTVTVIAGAVNVKVIAQTVDGTKIQGAQVLLVADTGTTTLPVNATVTITNSGTTATVSHTAHNLVTGDKVKIKGASHYQNNGVFTITLINANSYSVTLPSAPGSNPTGTITSTFCFLYGTTAAVTGEITMSRVLTGTINAAGWARKSSGSPFYKPAPVSGTVSTTTGAIFTSLLISDE